MTNKKDPTVEEIVQAWYGNRDGHDLFQMVKNTHEIVGIPIVFSEISYRYVDGNNIDPAQWQSMPGDVLDLQEQADLYEAFFRVWSISGSDWMKGVLWWLWEVEPNPPENPSNQQSPQNKPAEEIATGWFTDTDGNGLPNAIDNDPDSVPRPKTMPWLPLLLLED